MLLAEKKKLEHSLIKRRAELNAFVRLTKPQKMRGYDVFVKSVSSEILRSNPEARADPAEVQRIVQNEWLMLSEEKR